MAYRDSTTAAGNSATLSVAVPTGVAANDIVLIVGNMDASGQDFTGDYPAGFTEIFEAGQGPDGGRSFCAWKRLTGADAGSYTLAAQGVSADWIMQAFAFSGRDTGNPPVLSSAQNTAGVASPVSVNAPTVTALAGDDMFMGSIPDVAASGVGNGHAAPTNYIEQEDAEQLWVNQAGYTRDNVGAGATGTVTSVFTATSGNSGWTALHVRIPSAGGGGGGVTVKPLAALGVG